MICLRERITSNILILSSLFLVFREPEIEPVSNLAIVQNKGDKQDTNQQPPTCPLARRSVRSPCLDATAMDGPCLLENRRN